jgi:hypothetical protein
MNAYRPRRSHAPDSAEQHRNWLSLVEVSGPFLSLPVLRSTWPTLDPLDKPTRERLRLEHTTWQADLAAGQQPWIGYVLGDQGVQTQPHSTAHYLALQNQHN